MEMHRLGLRFIGVVKTAKMFPIDYLEEMLALVAKRPCDRDATTQGNSDATTQGNSDLLSYVWLDRQRRFFIATSHGVSYGTSYMRKQWRQVSEVELDEAPERVELEVPQPKATEVYYNTCGGIDQHNRCEQDDLNLEKKL